MISDETLYAFIDGTLSKRESNRIAALIDADPSLARRVENQRALIDAARHSFEEDLRQPVPDSWVAMIDAKMLPATSNNVKSLAVRRLRRKSGWHNWHLGAAAAASLVVGLYIGDIRSPDPLLQEQDGIMLASAGLADALGTGRSGVPVQLASGPSVDVQMSVRSSSGEYCREAIVSRPGSTADTNVLACRDDSGWRIVGIAQTPPRQMGYETASVRQPLDDLVSSVGGRVLDAQGEQAAIAADWRL